MLRSTSASDKLRHNYGVILREHREAVFTHVQDHEAGLTIRLETPKPPISLHFGCDSELMINANVSKIVCMLEHECKKTYNRLRSERPGNRITKSVRHKRDRGLQFLGNLLSIAIGTATEPMIGGLSNDIVQIVQGMGDIVASDDDRNWVIVDLARLMGEVIDWIDNHTIELNKILESLGTKFKQHVNFTTQLYKSTFVGNQTDLVVQINHGHRMAHIHTLIQYHSTLNKISETLDQIDEGRIPETLVKNQDIIDLIHKMTTKLNMNEIGVRPVGNLKSWRGSIASTVFNDTHITNCPHQKQ